MTTTIEPSTRKITKCDVCGDPVFRADKAGEFDKCHRCGKDLCTQHWRYIELFQCVSCPECYADAKVILDRVRKVQGEAIGEWKGCN